MMYRKIVTLLFIPAMVVACGEPPADEAAPADEPTAAAPSPDQAALDELAEYWETHYNMQHPDMVASVWTEDGWWLPADGGYHQGQAAIEASLTETMVDAPSIDITPVETRMFGDLAVSMGTYAVEPGADAADAMAFSGNYFNILQRVEGEWKILGSVANYDSERPEGWPYAEAMTEVPETEGSNVELAAAFQEAWNAGDIPALLDFYAEDSRVSFSDGPIHRGREALREDLEARMIPGSSIEIVNVGTIELDDNWMADGGWYQIEGPDGAGVVQSGWYVNLIHSAPDGTRTIHWALTNGRPQGGM